MIAGNLHIYEKLIYFTSK